MNIELNERLKREWTDQYVEVDTTRPELKRWSNIVGRVVTVNWNKRCVIDFQDGGWYDIAPNFLKKLPAEEGKKRFESYAGKIENSAQPIPERQG